MEILVNVRGINVNQRNNVEKNTPLHLAAQYKDDPEVASAITELLLEAGADPRYVHFVTSAI